MPRAALLSIHARVEGAHPASWDDSSLVQLWGPRYQVYVVPKRDFALFSLGRYPEGEKARARAERMAELVHGQLAGSRQTDREVGQALRIGNSLRYATTTGTIAIRWAGARAPVVWSVPKPEVDPGAACRELARRYLHIFAPGTPAAFARWAGIAAPQARAAFDELAKELTAVRTPIGEACILARDEAELRGHSGPDAAARLLPSGDAYYLLWGADRELLVPDARRRSALWTSRVWPGALLVDGEIVGTWRRALGDVSVELWRRLTRPQRAAVEEEAASLPLPGVERIVVRWGD